jgi:hypothetical protein
MKHFVVKRLLAFGAALFLFHAPLMAASPAELAEIRSQLRDLMERVDRLEQENAALKARNENLQAAGGRKSDTDAAGWVDRIALSGDVRYRHEQISDDTLNASGERSTADRYRDRVRARLNARAQVTEDIDVGIGFSTGEDGDPRSPNQSLDEVFSRKSVNLDLAYFKWSFADGLALTAGKMQQPFFKPGQSLFWDDDLNPEGLALTFERGVLFGTAYSYWVDEVSGAQSQRTSDAMLFGGQIGARLPLGEANLVLAAQYYDLSGGQGRAPFYNDDPNGNTTIIAGAPPAPVLLFDYQVLDLMAELNTSWDSRWGDLPLQIWADLARNQDPDDLETAWAVGAMLGDAAATRWELGAAYYSVEKDSLFAQLIDADLGDGQSDANGWVLRAGYAPVKNVTLSAAYFINKRNVDVANAAGQTDVDYDRLQLDLNMKF